MLSEATADHVAEQRALLEDGVLAAAGTIEVAPGVFEYADYAVRRILDGLDRLRGAEITDPREWSFLEAEIEQIYRAVKRHV
jgi:hypothetical protein